MTTQQQETQAQPINPAAAAVPGLAGEAVQLRDISSAQWKGATAAWLGWMFDGLDMHLYTLVAMPFVAELLAVNQKDSSVGWYASWIQAAFLIGWAFGGAAFGVVGDRIGRKRALVLTILVYAAFTGLSFFAHAWWQLMIFRFVAALGIGGEWAVGASLLSETWPRKWRPWIAAVLQSAVNCGVLLASAAVYLMSGLPPRSVFLVGVVPALLVLWIRRAVPETHEWEHARTQTHVKTGAIADLFRGALLRTTVLVLLVCGFSLTAHWAFMFWYSQHLRNLPELSAWTDGAKTALASQSLILLMVASIFGNFLAGLIARRVGFRTTIVLFCLAYGAAMAVTYWTARSHTELLGYLFVLGTCSGLFALFTMYLPPLFPTLLRTTGAGFCYNFGRVAAAFGTVFFGLFNKVGAAEYGSALFYAGFLFLPAAVFAFLLPETSRTTQPEP